MTKELTAEEVMEPLRKWVSLLADEKGWGADPLSMILTTFNTWIDQGKGIAVYENVELGHPQLGHRKYYSCGTPEAQFEGEPPERLPDFPTEINWRYILVGTYKGAPDMSGKFDSGAPIQINPGTEPLADSSPENAIRNMFELAHDVEVLEHKVEVQSSDIMPDDDGRWPFTLVVDGKAHEIEMPGWPLKDVRYMDMPDQNIWDFPRLYVDGNSWVWKYAVGILHASKEDEEDDE